jgi:putative endonuclease
MTVNHGVLGSSPREGAQKMKATHTSGFFYYNSMFCVYIIYSPKLDRYYIGSTDNFNLRIQEHNNAFYQDAFTKRGIPWEKTYLFEDLNSKQAYLIEKHLKKMKSKKYIQNLIAYPELSEKIKENYS